MIKKALIITVGIALLFCSCSEDEEPITAKYWPLAAGNEWKTAESYSWVITDISSGSSSSTTEYRVDSMETRDDGKKVWPLTHISYGEDVDTIPVVEYYYVTEDSVYKYLTKDADTPSTVEPNNLAVGMEWDGQLTIPVSIEQFTLENLPSHFKVAGSEAVTVPAGSFDCLRVEIDLVVEGDTVETGLIQWRAENAGIVKMTTDIATTYTVIPGYTVEVDIDGTSELTEKNW